MHFGVNLNNREALIAPNYDVPALLDLAATVEELGFDSIWVGDSLFSKPRYEPLSLLSAISQRTKTAQLGTACLVTATRDPLYLALEWATLDVVSGGRTILGACMGNAGMEEGVRREYAAVGLDHKQRSGIFEEGLEVLRELWTNGEVNFRGKHFDYDKVAFHSGTEPAPILPIQQPPPMWIVSNPRMIHGVEEGDLKRNINRASRRIARLGDGWLTCCRAKHSDELVEQLGIIATARDEEGLTMDGFSIAYQVTMNIADSEREARAGLDEYIAAYYPEMTKAGTVDLDEWGPVGTPDHITDWLEEFSQSGVTHFVCRFGAIDQPNQVDRFARDVLPRFRK